MIKDELKNELKDETLNDVSGGNMVTGGVELPQAGPQIMTSENPEDAEMVVNHNMDGLIHGCNC